MVSADLYANDHIIQRRIPKTLVDEDSIVTAVLHQPVLLTTKETSILLNCSIRKLEEDRKHSKGLPFYEFEGLIRYSLDDINEVINSGRVEHSAEEI